MKKSSQLRLPTARIKTEVITTDLLLRVINTKNSLARASLRTQTVTRRNSDFVNTYLNIVCGSQATKNYFISSLLTASHITSLSTEIFQSYVRI